jgi:hypothetical protein
MRHHQEKFSRQLVDPCSRSTSTLYTISHCLEVRSVTLAYGQSLHVLHSQEDFVMHSCILFVQTETPCCKCYFSRSDFITMSGCGHEKKDYYKCKVDWLIDWLIMSMGWDVSEPQPPTGLLFILWVICKHGEPWWWLCQLGKTLYWSIRTLWQSYQQTSASE